MPSTKAVLLAQRIRQILSNKWCWRVVVGLFLLEALWLVCSAQYPMAFDENYHFGLIKLHAQQWVPFFTSQPNTGVFGEVVRDPSYLYHWLMSFPYRLISLFTDNQVTQVVLLRLINVGLFAYGLVLYRRILRRLGVSEALSNALFAIFILVPVVPFLAAHINYDNLLFVAIPLVVLLAFRLTDKFSKKTVDAADVLVLITVLALSSLIKFPFLPVLMATVLYAVWRLWRSKLLSRLGWNSFVASFRALSGLKQVVLVVACLLSLGLFVERYGVNMVKYHNPVPACDAVISQAECLQYGPYNRDYGYIQSKPANFRPNILQYTWQWFRGMWYRLFFAITYTYANFPPMLLISRAATLCAVLAVIGVGLRFRALFSGNQTRQLVAWITVAYLVVLFADGFSSYVKTGRYVAINGRYLIPFLPFLFAFGGLAWVQLLQGQRAVKTVFASLVIAIFVLQGGGAMGYIIRGDDSWYWDNSAIRTANRMVRNAASPLIIDKSAH